MGGAGIIDNNISTIKNNLRLVGGGEGGAEWFPFLDNPDSA